MMDAIKKTTCTLVVLAATSTSMVAMAKDIDVKVIGTITPNACNINVDNNATFDYGTIPRDKLLQSQLNVLELKTVGFNIACDGPAKLALTAQTGRPGSAVGSDGNLGDIVAGPAELGGAAVGLGMDGEKGIGGYALHVVPGTVTLDGNRKATVIEALGSEGSLRWENSREGSLFMLGGNQHISWADGQIKIPATFKNMTDELSARAYINRASELDLSKAITLDGMSSLELVYL